MPKLYLCSLGCNKNLVDSEIMLGRLQNYEVVNSPDDADVMIVNTCGFRVEFYGLHTLLDGS